jgi:hypothetical protein
MSRRAARKSDSKTAAPPGSYVANHIDVPARTEADQVRLLVVLDALHVLVRTAV